MSNYDLAALNVHSDKNFKKGGKDFSIKQNVPKPNRNKPNDGKPNPRHQREPRKDSTGPRLPSSSSSNDLSASTSSPLNSHSSLSPALSPASLALQHAIMDELQELPDLTGSRKSRSKRQQKAGNKVLVMSGSSFAGSRGGAGGGGRASRGGGGRAHHHHYPSYSYRKETFVQANYRFLLAPGDHVNALHDPDRPAEWEAVQCVCVPVIEDPPCCPICLDQPVAPKITKCGHIFCYTCILHYLSMGEKSWRRCPLCFESIYPKALKSCEFEIHPKYKPGDVIDFVLMKRYKDSIIPFPHAPGIQASADALMAGFPDPYPASGVSRFARVSVISDITPIIHRERQELLAAMEHNQKQLKEEEARRKAKAAAVPPTPLSNSLSAIVARAESAAPSPLAPSPSASSGLPPPSPPASSFPPLPQRSGSIKRTPSTESMRAGAAGAGGAASSHTIPAPTVLRRDSSGLSMAETLAASLPPPSPSPPLTLNNNSKLTVEGGDSADAVYSAMALEALEARLKEWQTQGPPDLTPVVPGAPLSMTQQQGSPRTNPPMLRTFSAPPDLDPSRSAFYDSDEDIPRATSSITSSSPSLNPQNGTKPSSASSDEKKLSAKAKAFTPLSSPTPAPAPPSPASVSTSAPHKSVSVPGFDVEANGGRRQEDTYYFYQSADGQQIYLHAFNFRSLLGEVADKPYLLPPTLLSAKIIDQEHFVQDEDSRRKVRFLSHLPLTSSFSIYFVDVSEHLSAPAKKKFEEQVAQRNRRREAIAREHARLEKEAKEKEIALARPKSFSGFRSDYDDHVPEIDAGHAPNHFPDLNPLGLAVRDSPPSSPSLARSATEPGVSGWSLVASQGFASSSLWAALPKAESKSNNKVTTPLRGAQPGGVSPPISPSLQGKSTLSPPLSPSAALSSSVGSTGAEWQTIDMMISAPSPSANHSLPGTPAPAKGPSAASPFSASSTTASPSAPRTILSALVDASSSSTAGAGGKKAGGKKKKQNLFAITSHHSYK